MAFHLNSPSKKQGHLKQKYDEKLVDLISDVHQHYTTLAQLQQNAYDLREDLGRCEKRAEAKYLCVLGEAKERQIQADISAPKKAKQFRWRKRTNRAEDIFYSE